MLTELGTVAFVAWGMLGMSWELLATKFGDLVTFFFSLTWNDFKALGHDLFWLAVLLSFIGTLRKLGTIREIIREFNAARGPIWDLRETISQLSRLQPVIRELRDQMELLYAKIEAAQKQVAELQVESVSGRTDDADGSQVASPQNPDDDEVEHNWEVLRSYWRRNTARIEYIIENIKDGRSRIAYDRMPRTNYPRIVEKLKENGLITAAAANASRELFDLFNSYRPKNRTVPDSVVGVVGLLDKQLDQELVSMDIVVASEDEGAKPNPFPNQPTRRTPDSSGPTASPSV